MMIAIVGPTACGKTALAAALAADIDAEIISADSRQVYKAMDIGTGKDLADYTVHGRQVPYHLIDIVQPGEKYNIFQYQHDFIKAYDDITSRLFLKTKSYARDLRGGRSLNSLRCYNN